MLVEQNRLETKCTTQTVKSRVKDLVCFVPGTGIVQKQKISQKRQIQPDRAQVGDTQTGINRVGILGQMQARQHGRVLMGMNQYMLIRLNGKQMSEQGRSGGGNSREVITAGQEGVAGCRMES